MKKIIKIAVLLSVIFALAACNATVARKTPDEDIHIFFTSDVHCGVEDNLTMASVKALVDEARGTYKYVSLVDCGDYVQGGTIGSLSKGKLVIELMNAMDYDIVTIGNHEFDYGMEELSKRMSEAEYEIVASNVVYSGNNVNIFEDIPEYVIKEYGNVKVAFLGVLTPESIISSTPKFFMEDGVFVYDFYSGNEGQNLYDRVQEVVDKARKDGADYVVALTHLGSIAAYAPYDSISLISHTTGIDVVLDGHSHSLIIGDAYPNKNGEDVILSSVGTKLEALGELIIATDGSITTMHVTEYNAQDEGIIDSLAGINEELSKILDQKVCNLDYDLKILDEEGIRMVRSRETTAGDFVADAFRYVMEADIGIANGGSVRKDIPAGEVDFGDLLDVTPFQNNLALVRTSGQSILDALEFASSKTEALYKFDGNPVGENGAFLQVSGLKYTIDTSIDTPVILDENSFLTGFNDGPRRVSEVYVLEEGEYVPIDPDKMYTVAAVDYLLFNSGDGNTAFKDSEALIEAGTVDVEALRIYLEAMGGFGDAYRQTEGRITIR